MKTTRTSLSALVLLAGCSASNTPPAASAPPPQAKPAPSAPAPSVEPLSVPPKAAERALTPFPAIAHRELGNGLKLRVVERGELPIVELRLVVFSGQATDGAKAGLAAVAGELLKAGGAGAWTSRALAEEAEKLGGELDVLTDRDATTISLAVSSRDFERALELIAAVALKPRFLPAEFQKLKQREIERVTSLSRTSPSWMASMVMYRELFRQATGQHPYANFDGTPESLSSLSLADCRAWHKRHVVPKNATLIVAGHVTAAEAEQSAQRILGAWQGDAPEPLAFPPAQPPAQPAVYVVDRPASPQAQIYVSTLGPERKSADWAVLKTANQILGGGVSGRLFLDVREKRSLAYSTSSSVEELAHGPVPLILGAGTQTPKAGLAVAGLLEHMQRIASTAPSSDEIATATRYLSDSFSIAMESTGAVAGLTTRLAVFDLPDDYYDRYRQAVRGVRAADVQRVAAQYFKSGSLIIVAGDAERLGQPLRRFAPVNVIDPEHGFATVRVLPQDTNAKLTADEAPAAAPSGSPLRTRAAPPRTPAR